MVHMGDHRHVSDVGLFVHDLADLVYSEVHLRTKNNPYKKRCLLPLGVLFLTTFMNLPVMNCAVF